MDYFRQPHEELLKNIQDNLEKDLLILKPSAGSSIDVRESQYLVENILKSIEDPPLKQKTLVDPHRRASSVEQPSSNYIHSIVEK
jgi:hypothetical protein